MELIVGPLGYLMKICYDTLDSYIWAIVVFAIVTKVILFPVAVWVQKNSIKMIKITPEINRIKAKFYGDGESIAEHQSALFKKVKYNPFASIIPLFIQILLLIGVIQVIYNPITYLFQLPQETINELIKTTMQLTGVNGDVASIQISVINAIQNPEYTNAFLELGIVDIESIVQSIQKLDTKLWIFDVSVTPVQVWGIATLVPILAGLSSWVLCLVQNVSNVLQSEQSGFTKYFTMILSVGISVYLGLFVPAGVAFYWIIGNIYAILQLFFLNAIISPKKHIDYKELDDSRVELQKINSLGTAKKKWYKKDENHKREKEDYKKFFSILNKKLVFYSEKSGFYKYYEDVIRELLAKSNIKIHYVTSDPNDQIFEIAKNEPRIKPYYIGERKLITLMMKMDAQIVVMTMPDLQNFHYKRSLVKKDVEYIYMFHAPLCFIMTLRDKALDNYDTVFCTGVHQFKEIRESERLYNLPEKTLVEEGYGVIESMMKHFEEGKEKYTNKAVKTVLVAPTWNEDNILDSCLDEVLDKILNQGFKIIVRPHPEYVKRFPEKINAIKEKYTSEVGDYLEIQTDFSSNETVYSADILITDWSGVAYEYSLATLRPSIFINTKMKVVNPKWEKLDLEPIAITLRDKVGVQLEKDEISDKLLKSVLDMMNRPKEYADKIEKLRDEYVYNIGQSGKAGASYIISKLVKGNKK